MTAKNDIDFQKDLWEAANKMQGSVSPADYKKYVLPLIFLRYLTLRYQKNLDFILKEFEEGGKYFDFKDEDDEFKQTFIDDELLSMNVYKLDEISTWDYIKNNAKQDNIKEILDNAMKEIEKLNPDLEGVLPRVFQASTMKNEEVSGLIEIFSRDVFSARSEESIDVLGRVYEYFISEFAASEGKRGGEFFTPSSIVNLIVHMLKPEEGILLDVACGSGGMFVQSERYSKHKNSLSFYGQEYKDTNVTIGKMNVLLHGLNANIKQGDSLLDDQFLNLKADFIVANPPFNSDDWGADKISSDDPRLLNVEGGLNKTNSNANYMWIQHMLHHLNDKGKAGIVMANGALTTMTNGERQVREKLIELGMIDAIVQLPAKLFLGTGIPSCIFVLNKNRSEKKEILFIDARELGTPVSRKNIAFSQDEINSIAQKYFEYENEMQEYEDVEGFCKRVSLEEIKNNGYKLTPGIYVGTKIEVEDDTPYEEKVKELHKELQQLFLDGNGLQEQILKDLEVFVNDK